MKKSCRAIRHATIERGEKEVKEGNKVKILAPIKLLSKFSVFLARISWKKLIQTKERNYIITKSPKSLIK